jgi:hypothetical protein
MANALKTTTELPLVSCSRSDIEDLIEKSVPDTGMADGVTLHVVDDAVTVTNAVPHWEKIVLDFEDVAALGAVLTGTVALFTLPDHGVVHAVKIMSTVQWAGAGIATLAADLGTAGTPDKYLSAYDLLVAPATDQYDKAVVNEFEESTVSGGGGGTPLVLQVTATAANLDQLSAGEVAVWVLWSATDI